MPVVELAFARQVHALGKARRERGLNLRHALAVEHLHGGQFGDGGAGAFELLAHARGLLRILAVPDEQRALLLEVHRHGQRCQQLGPACERMAAHAHHAMLGNGRLGQRSQHATGHTGGRMFAQWAALVVNGHAVALARK